MPLILEEDRASLHYWSIHLRPYPKVWWDVIPQAVQIACLEMARDNKPQKMKKSPLRAFFILYFSQCSGTGVTHVN